MIKSFYTGFTAGFHAKSQRKRKAAKEISLRSFDLIFAPLRETQM